MKYLVGLWSKVPPPEPLNSKGQASARTEVCFPGGVSQTQDEEPGTRGLWLVGTRCFSSQDSRDPARPAFLGKPDRCTCT